MSAEQEQALAQASYQLLCPKGHYAALPVLVAANYCQIHLKHSEAPAKLAAQPKGGRLLELCRGDKTVAVEGPQGTVSGPHAAARFVASIRTDVELLGKNLWQEAQVDSWCEFAQLELQWPLASWLHLAGEKKLAGQEGLLARARQEATTALRTLDTHLEANTYMVGSAVTLADVVVACCLLQPFLTCVGQDVRDQFPSVMRWFNTIMHQNEVSALVLPKGGGELALAAESLPKLPA